MNVSRPFIDRPRFAAVISIIIIVAGLLAVETLPIEQYPQIVPPQVVVSATYPGADAETIAQTVAAPLEQQINGVADEIYMSSASDDSGRMTLSVTFAIGSDPEVDTINVNNRVQRARAQLPQAVAEQGVQVRKRSSSILEIIALTSPSKAYSPLYISNYALLHIIDQLNRLPGVGQARLFGAKNYAIRVWLDPAKMSRYQVTSADIADAIQSQNQQFAAGKLAAAPDPQKRPFTFTVTAPGRFSSVRQFKHIVLRTRPDGGALLLKDVARVSLGSQTYGFKGRYNNKPSVPIGISLSPGANAVATAQAVNHKMAQLARRFPSGMAYKVSFTTTKFVRASIQEVIKTFIEALILVIVVIFVFLQDWRAALIPVLAIPVAIIGTFVGMFIVGFSINLLTLFGLILAIGLVVDDAIIVIENCTRIMTDENCAPKQAAVRAMGEVSEPIVAITLVMASIFIPVSFLGGLAGRMYRQFAVTIALSMIISALVALTLSPMLCALLLKRKRSEPWLVFRWFNRGFDWTRARYIAGVGWLLRYWIVGVVLFIAFGVGTLFMFRLLPTSLVPSEDEGVLLVNTTLPPASALWRTDAYNQALVKHLLALKPVVSATSFAGFSLLQSAQRPNAGTLFLKLKNWSDRGAGVKKIINRINRVGAKLENGRTIAINPPPIPGISTTGGFTGYVQALSGANEKQLEKVAHKLVATANKRPELARVRTTIDTHVPSYRARLDRRKARSLGLSVTDVYNALQSNFGTRFVNRFNLFSRNYQVSLQAKGRFRETPDNLKDIFVRSSTSGELVPLSSVVTLTRTQSAPIVQRFNIYPAAQVVGQPAPGYSSGQAIAAMQAVADKVLSSDYRLSWTGATYQEQVLGTHASLAYAFAILLVFLILSAQYERWTLPVAVLTAAPFALFGAIGAMLLRGLQSDVYFQIGLLVLVGLASKNAILIVEYAADLRAEEGLSIVDAAVKASYLRFRPIIMTSLAFIAGTLPLALASGASANSRHSIGTAVVGGMLGATILAIFFVPLFYMLLTQLAEDWARRRQARRAARGEQDGIESADERR